MFTECILATGVSVSKPPLPADTLPVLPHALFEVGRVDETQETHTLFDGLRLLCAVEYVQAKLHDELL